MTTGKIIAGIILIIVGILLYLIPFVGLVWGTILLVLGIVMIISKDEEKKITQRKDQIKHAKK